jgi:LacI family transcriptional regulator
MDHISLRDVAVQAGVSLPTVSKVLQGKGMVSPQTRARILQAAEALEYVPNMVARSLVSQKTSTIGTADIPYRSEWVEEGDWQIRGGYQAT